MRPSTWDTCEVNEASVNKHLASLLVEAELDEYRVANYQLSLLFLRSFGEKLRRVSIVFDCMASVMPWEEVARFKGSHVDKVTCRQKILGDLFLLFGSSVNEVATKPDGSLCLKFNERQAMVLHVNEDDLGADDWIWRVEGEADGENKRSVSCVVEQVGNRRDIKFLVK
jgi:hypothetical protein